MRRRLCLLATTITMAGLMAGAASGFAANGAGPAGSVASDAPAPLPPADPAAVPGYDHDPLSILGPTRVSPEQLAAFVESRVTTTHTTVPLDQLARIYVEEGAAYGVRADLAWAQSIIETGSFTFPKHGLVHPDDNNFAGIGACDSCSNGHGYPDARTGVRAQMQLLRGYADPNTLEPAMIHPPKSYRGIAPTWWQMGNGRWATAPNYASAVIGVYRRMTAFAGVPLEYSPPIDALVEPAGQLRSRAFAAVPAGPPPEPEAQPGDGLYVADPQGRVTDLGDARFWGMPFDDAAKAPVVAMAMTPAALGYWIVRSDGSISAFGDARTVAAVAPGVVAMAARPNGDGFWTVDANGSVHAYGDAPDISPAPGAVAKGARVVGIAATSTGAGYWIVDSFGRVVAVGDATSLGDADPRLVGPADPAVGIAPTRADDGYWIATAGGRVLHFGAAAEHGGLVDELTNDADWTTYPTAAARRTFAEADAPRHLVVAVLTLPRGSGYWLVTADGLVLGRGDAPDFALSTDGVPVLSATGRR